MKNKTKTMMISVYIADYDKAFRSKLVEAVKKDTQLSLVGHSGEGRRTLREIKELRPDVIIMDPNLTYIDGFYIVRKLHDLDDYIPKIYIVSRLNISSYLQVFNQDEIIYVNTKPIYPVVIIQNLKELFCKPNKSIKRQKPNKPSADSEIYRLFDELGIPSYYTSTKRTVTALSLCLSDETYLSMLTIKLYPEVGSFYGISKSAVERSIRSSINFMIEKNSDIYNKLFDTPSITNMMFLHMVVRYLTRRSE